MCRLSVNCTFMTHHKAGYRTGDCNGSDHAINLNRARRVWAYRRSKTNNQSQGPLEGTRW